MLKILLCKYCNFLLILNILLGHNSARRTENSRERVEDLIICKEERHGNNKEKK